MFTSEPRERKAKVEEVGGEYRFRFVREKKRVSLTRREKKKCGGASKSSPLTEEDQHLAAGGRREVA